MITATLLTLGLAAVAALSAAVYLRALLALLRIVWPALLVLVAASASGFVGAGVVAAIVVAILLLVLAGVEALDSVPCPSVPERFNTGDERVDHEIAMRMSLRRGGDW